MYLFCNRENWWLRYNGLIIRQFDLLDIVYEPSLNVSNCGTYACKDYKEIQKNGEVCQK